MGSETTFIPSFLSSTSCSRTSSLTPLGAGEGNRTLVVSLEGFCSTIELHPRIRLTEGYRSHSRGVAAYVTSAGETDPWLPWAEPLGGGGRIRTFEGRAGRFT